MAQFVDDVCSSSNFNKKGGESADNSTWVLSTPCRARLAGECSASDITGRKCGSRFWHSSQKFPLNSAYREIRPLSAGLHELSSAHLRRISDAFIPIRNHDPDQGPAACNWKIHEDIQMVGILCLRYLSVPIYHDPRAASTESRRLIPAATSSNFLDFCYLCKRRLDQGNDIFIYRYAPSYISLPALGDSIYNISREIHTGKYGLKVLRHSSNKFLCVRRGDRAFCSIECRYEHIILDEQSQMGSLSAPHSKSITRSISEYNLNGCDDYKNRSFNIPCSSSSYSFPR